MPLTKIKGNSRLGGIQIPKGGGTSLEIARGVADEDHL